MKRVILSIALLCQLNPLYKN
ncbi:MAG: hypothetical protein JJP05_00045 [cyanobacterium endosymbiont of Rhopalodia gibba]